MDTVESTTSQVFEALPPAKDSVSSITFLTASLWYWSWVFFKIMNYVVVIIPTIFLNMLQMNFQITLSLSSILTCLAITVSLCYFIVRHKYLTRYSKETLPPLQDSSSHGTRGIDYVEGSRKKRGTDKTKTYLDEFLSAIKVFGYLERPVFHELTRNMTTQRLEADEILYLDEKLGFSIVVEGSVQVYTKIHDKHGSHFEFDQDTDKADKDDILVIKGQHYQLLNEVKSGAALSSLLSTLDLFHTRNTALSSPALPPVSNRASVLARPKPMLHNRLNSRQSSTSTPIEPLSLSPMHDSSSVTQSRGEGYFSSPRLNTSGLQGQPESTVGTPMDHGSFPLYDHSFSELPEVVARPKPSSPKSDFPSTATIAIIPGSAFQRVQARYPKATSHIVTMVLTRMYKVTMNTVHTYLGLIREVFDSEIALNSIHEECKLPSYLYDGVIESYNQQRAEEVDGASMPIFAKSKKRQRKLHRENSSRYVVLANRSKPSHPGDLLSSVPLSRTSDYVKLQGSSVSDETSNLTSGDSQRQLPNEPNSSSSPTLKKSKPKRRENIRNRSFSDEREETEETSLRIAIVENLFKLLGVDENSSNLNMSGISSGQLSGNSSTVGLSSLMSDQSLPINMERNFFETERNKDAAFNSSYSGYRASFPQSSQKFYNTIVHTKPEVAESEISTPNSRRPSHSSSEVNFATVKNAFSKHIEVKYYKPGEIIVEQNGMSPGLFYVIHGGLDIIHKSPKDNEHDVVSKRLYSVKPGGMAGYLSSIVGLRSLVSIKSSKYDGAIVAHISKNDLTRLLDKFYFLQLPIAAKLKSLLPSLIVTIDFALEWCHIPAGGVLCSQGDLANGFHIVLSGRFRVVKNKKMKNEAEDEEDDLGHLIDESNIPRHHQDNDDFEILGEYGHGASIGEVEVLTASRRTNSLIAVRDSETARIPRTLFEMLSLQNPSIMVKVSRIVANRSLEASKRDRTNTLIATTSKSSVVEINNDYKTITILPATNGLPVREFADKLVHALRALDRRVIALDRTSTLSHLGRYAFDERLAQLRLSGYFAYLEEVYQTVVYICDSPLKSSWTSTCISQGDCILLLADAEDYDCAANVGDYERLLLKLKTTARTELCLLHPEPSVFPGSTSIWLKNRIWVQGHHHIHMEVPKQAAPKPHKRKSNMLTDLATKLSTKANPNIKMKFSNVKSRAMNSLIKLNARTNKAENVPVLYKNDFMRLARILSNEAVGLVLGGGGSRGISHVGVVTALEKHGIPVDLIGGTSIGSFVGGLYAKENNIVSIYGMTKKFSRRIGAVWRMLFDLTYPVTSYITGHEFNRGIWKVFGVHEIEDFWIRYYCNSTNITTSTMEIHERGYAWRFIRASMSLAGLLPPITYNGSMLLDGGYLDNLPVMEMKVRGAKHIVAVDVGSVDDRTPMNYGDTLSGFWVLLNRWNPFSKHPNVPNMMDIQLRLAYVASVNALEAAKKMPGVMYLRPPIDDYATLDFMKFDEIYNVGLAYADDTIGRWAKEGKLPKFAGVTDLKSKEGDHPKRRFRRNSI